MILEVATLDVRLGQERDFESAIARASGIIAGTDGYVSHRLQVWGERPSRDLLPVEWQTLEDHTVGFRQSTRYQEWKRLPHCFYDPLLTVEHYTRVM